MSESVRDRLERLLRVDRREAAPKSGEEAGAVSRVPKSLPEWMRRRLRDAGRDSLVRRDRSVDLPKDLREASNKKGAFAFRRILYPLDQKHGDFELGAALASCGRLVAMLAREERLSSVDPASFVFLDTETTGLSGGAGTYVYLVGLGRFVEDSSAGRAFEFWQGFLRDPSEERALLCEVERRLEEASCLVSFFGKSYDRHRLADRMRIQGISVGALLGDALPHLDLYHVLRRLHHAFVKDTKLRTMESSYAGVERKDDLPGSFAPAAWFDFLKGRPHLLEAVFEHNRLDVLSLVALLVHCSESARSSEIRGREDSTCQLCLADGARELGWQKESLEAYERVAASPFSSPEQRLIASDRLRKAGKLELAQRVLEELCRESSPLSFAALEALAKLIEIQRGDPLGALACIERSLSQLESAVRARVENSALSRGVPSFSECEAMERLELRRSRLTKRLLRSRETRSSRGEAQRE